MFLFQRLSSTLFVITRSSSLLRVSVDIKNNVEKESTLLFCFLSKSPVGHGISRQKHLELSVTSVIPVDWVILHWYACGANGRTVGRKGVRSHDYQNFSDGWMGEMDYQIFLGVGLRSRAGGALISYVV